MVLTCSSLLSFWDFTKEPEEIFSSGDNWIRLKHGRKEKGSDTKFTLLSRKNVDNENEAR